MVLLHKRRVVCCLLLVSSQVASFQTKLAQPLIKNFQTSGRYEQFIEQPTIHSTVPSISCAHYRPLTSLKSSPTDDDKLFDAGMTVSAVAGQSLLIGIAVLGAIFFNTPNYGLGPDISFSGAALVDGIVKTIPLGLFAYILDFFEKDMPALQNVTKATQRTILSLLGGKFKPVIAIVFSIALGLAAGLGEEMLFRGIMQYELQSRLGDILSLGITATIFGLLHAVTPVYALLATMAGAYFGWIYQSAGNLAVPIITHTVYDIAALFYAHWIVTRMTEEEQQAIVEWESE